MHTHAKRILIGCAIAGLGGFALAVVDLIIGAGGHGPELPLTVSFPFSKILNRVNPILPHFVPSTVGLVQFPLYALAYQLSPSRTARIITALALVVLHGLAVWACFLSHEFYERFW